MKQLIVKEFTTKMGEQHTYIEGWKYSYFQDPKTGKWYRPKEGYGVYGDNLDEWFEEVT